MKIHPQTAREYQLEQGRPARIGNEKGSVTVTVNVLENIQRDTVVVEGIWPASAFPDWIGINLLISAEPAAPNGGAVFHDTAVWVEPV
ncbi:MAG: molybdopterin dinucleotide binding domain-containing protein [Arenicellales bacterium]